MKYKSMMGIKIVDRNYDLIKIFYFFMLSLYFLYCIILLYFKVCDFKYFD